MDFGTVAVGDVLLIPLIVALIQFCKSLAPKAPGDVWRVASFVLGLIGQFVVFLIAHGESAVGWSLSTWMLCAVTGFAFALAAGKAYDETLGKTRS